MNTQAQTLPVNMFRQVTGLSIGFAVLMILLGFAAMFKPFAAGVGISLFIAWIIAGLATGSLIGLLGGPVGAAVGAVAGTLTGSFFDLIRVGVSDDFLTEVYLNLVPNKWAVVAEVDETWVTPLDTRMEAIGGVVFRRGRGEFIDIQIEREIAADKAEIERLETEYKQAVGEAKTKLQAKVDAARKKYEGRRELLVQRIDEIQREGDAKIKLMQEQVAKATGQAKANLEQRVADERAKHNARIAKLRQAWQLVKEAAAV